MKDSTELKSTQPVWVIPDEGYLRWLKHLEPRDDGHRYYTGFPSHDQCVGHFQRGGLYIYGARPGVGKTAYLLSMAARQARLGVRVYYLNMEMSVEQMCSRLYCLHVKDSSLKYVTERDFTDADYARFVAVGPALKKASPYWCEQTDFGTFARLAKETITPSATAMIVVDYLGLFSMRGLGPGDNFILISEVAKQLKLMARALDIPVIAAAQLNRDVEKRKDAHLTMADLRGSGELENHADGVFGLSRENSERLEVAVLKNRNGPLTDYNLHFDAPRAAVEEWEE